MGAKGVHNLPPHAIYAPKNPHCPQVEYVSASASMSWWARNGSLKVDDADTGYTGGPRNHKPIKVLRLSTSNPVACRRSGMQSLHQKLAAG